MVWSCLFKSSNKRSSVFDKVQTDSYTVPALDLVYDVLMDGTLYNNILRHLNTEAASSAVKK